MTNKNNNFQGDTPKLSKRFTLAQQGHVSRAFDNIIMHCREIALDARSALEPDNILTLRDLEETERNAQEVNFVELQKLAGFLVMYVPDIPHSALIASLYKHTDFLPPDEEDSFEQDEQVDFIEAEHGKETADYFDALIDLEFRNPKKDYFAEDKFRLAAKAALTMQIFSDLDVPEYTDFLTMLGQTSLEGLELSYERLIYLRAMAGELDDPLDKFYEDHYETLEEAIDSHTRGAINNANIEMKNGPKLF